MHKIIFAASAVGLMLTTAAQANNKCDAAKTSAEITECADGDLKVLDAQLNKAYRDIEHRIADDHDAKSSLIAAERAWVHFRDNECKFSASGVEGGSVYASVVLGCTADLTAKRIADLKGYLSCEEGDMSCPVPAAD